MRMRRLLITLVAFIAAATAIASHPAAATLPARPKLVVTIIVDQLRTDYIEYLQPLMSQGGFAELKRGGLYLRDLEFQPALLDRANASALLMTGAWPADNGVTAATEWDPSALRSLSSLNDPKVLGVNTSETLSPTRLLLSTLSDELMIDGAGLSAVHSIALDPVSAIIMAGHAGTSAAWLNLTDGRWATSSYYKELPQPASNRNMRQPLSQRVDTMQWKPLLPLSSYPGLPSQKRQYEFRHTFPSRQKDVYEQFAASPRGNEEVTSLAIDYLKSLNLGRRGDTIDMLCLGYTVAPFRAVKDGDYRLELQDSYLRLDRQIARLLEALKTSVGLDNCVIMIAGTGYYNDAVPDDAKYRIPSGNFSTKRAIALLNGFLSGKYGPGNYVDTYAGGGFYLSAKQLESKGIDPAEAAKLSKEFLMKMSGVSRVYTLSEILNPADDETRALRLATDARTAPQLTLLLTPGWNLVEDHQYPERITPVRRGAITSPAFIYAPSRVNPSVKTEAVNAAALAPTLSSILHLRSPNGAFARPITY